MIALRAQLINLSCAKQAYNVIFVDIEVKFYVIVKPSFTRLMF